MRYIEVPPNSLRAEWVGHDTCFQKVRTKVWPVRSDRRRRKSHRNTISKARVNSGTPLVGSPHQIAKELLGYWRLGTDEFILSGYPHLEASWRVAHDLLPCLKTLIAGERTAS